MKITLIATTTMGFESVLAREIKALGFEKVKVFDYKVEFEATLADICKVNLWLRTAGRIYVKLGEFKATTFDSLFDQTKALPWGDWIQPNDEFPVAQVTSRKSVLFSKSTCQSIVKKAVVNALKATHKVKTLPETGALCPIRIQIDKDVAILSIDTSGTGLNKRGYRSQTDRAPIRETLAAGLILLSRWRPGREPLMDPFCGSGTLLIEAGLIARKIAPGLNRTFGSEDWKCLPARLWSNARREAKDHILPSKDYHIHGSDNNPKALEIARDSIKLSGLDQIFVQKRDISEIESRFDTGTLVTNPPYGERLDDQQEAERLYTEMGKVLRANFSDWAYHILTPHDRFDRVFGQQSTKNRKVYNGGIKCWFYSYLKKG